jgi:hypothetical protein
MEKGGWEPSDVQSQMAEERRNRMSEKRKVIMAVTQMLDSGTLDERSSQLLEQLAGCILCPPKEATHKPESDSEASQQATSPRGEPPETESSGNLGVEPSPNGIPGNPAEERAFVGSLRTTTEDRWKSKVPSCTGKFHRLKDCRLFHSMEPGDRIKLVDQHGLCLGCLTPGHGRAARSCPYEEERADVCQRSACRGRHHYLLHVEQRKTKKSPKMSLPAQPPGMLGDPTPTEDPGCEVQLVAQWVTTKGGVPSLVFWDTGAQVALVTQKMAHAIGLTAIPSSPLRLEGIGDGYRPRAATRFKVPLVDTGGRVTVTAYGVDNIMSPLAGGDVTLMREAFLAACRWAGFDIRGGEPAYGAGQPQPVSN